MIEKILGILFLVWLVVFLIRLVLEAQESSDNINAFMDKWVKSTAWIWLPFYALQRLIKEVILGKK